MRNSRVFQMYLSIVSLNQCLPKTRHRISREIIPKRAFQKRRVIPFLFLLPKHYPSPLPDLIPLRITPDNPRVRMCVLIPVRKECRPPLDDWIVPGRFRCYLYVRGGSEGVRGEGNDDADIYL